MKLLNIVTAVLETGAGLALLLLPSAVSHLLLGTALATPAALTVARVAGAALLALGVACWFARNETKNQAAGGLVAGMLVYNIATVAVLAYAGIGFDLHGLLLWPAVILHAAMSAWCLFCLRFQTSPNLS